MKPPLETQLAVWDTSGEPTIDAGTVYRWSGRDDDGPTHSVLSYVEQHGERLRRKYLAWVHDVGEAKIAGKRLIDHLALGDGLSYWWLTSIVEKSPYKSPPTDAIRLRALEEIIVEQGPARVRLVSADRRLSDSLGGLCQRLGIDYHWERTQGEPSGWDHESGDRRSPPLLQALRSLGRRLRAGLPFRRAERSGWFAGDRAVFFCGYFFNVVPEEAAEGRYHSGYWGGLHGLMRSERRPGNWLHHNPRPAAATALGWVRRFNQHRDNHGYHVFLDTYLSWRVVLRVIGRWLRLSLLYWRLGDLDDAFRPQGSALSLWPLLKQDWRRSLQGGVAIANLLTIELFDEALRELPHQKLGLYLCENNEWERAFIHAWRKHGHGRLIAVPHTTVSFWDLRHFIDQRVRCESGVHPMPLPDLTALNGPAAVDGYLSAGVPRDAIVECEALRFAHLRGMRRTHSAPARSGGPIRVLIIGDIMASFTAAMLRLLEEAKPRIPADTMFDMKPHPASPIRPEGFPSLDLTLVSEPLTAIFTDYDVAYASATTSGAVEAWLAGLPVAVMLDEAQLNFSPLRGRDGVRFVSTPEELAEALAAPDREAAGHADADGFFHLDPDLPRWQRILASSE